MTNSEAIKQLVYVRRNLDEYLDEDRINTVNIAISVLEENDKLKAEIEQLKSDLEQSEITRNKQIDALLQEIKQLESIINAYEVKKDFKEFWDNRDIEEGKLKFIEVE